MLYDEYGARVESVREYFSGDVYENEDIAVADTARRFETKALLLKDALITVTGYAQYFGDADNQRTLVQAGGGFGLTCVDISQLYFKNVAAGENGCVNILATKR